MVKSIDVWMPLYIADYMRDTTRLTTEQHGAYLLLLMDYWINGALPDDDSVLQSVTKTDAKTWRKIRPVVSQFFTIKGGTWKNKRADLERSQAAEVTKERREAGRLGAAKRWGKTDGKANSGTNGKSMAEPSALPSTDIANRKQTAWQNDAPSQSPIPIKDTAEHNPAREPDPDAWRLLGEQCCAAAGLDTGRLAVDFRAVTGWLDAGFDPERDILTTIRAIAAKPGYQPPGGLAYFTKPIAETNRQRRNPLPVNLDRRPKPAAPPPQASEVYAAMGLGSVRKIDAKAENLAAGAKVEPISARGASINTKAIQGAKK